MLLGSLSTSMRPRPRTDALPPALWWLCVAWACASLADWFVLWAVLWSAGLEGWSGVQTAGVIVAARAPALVGGIAGGLAIDRYGPRRLMLIDGLVRAVAMLGLVAVGLLADFAYVAVLALVALAASTAPISYSGVRTMLPRLVSVDQLGRANTLLTIGNALPLVLSAVLVGPALGWLGLSLSFVVPATLMCAVLILTLRLPATDPEDRAARPPAHTGGSVLDENLSPDVERSLRWRRVPAGGLALLGLSTAYYFTFGPVEPVLPLLVRDHLGAGATTYGLLWSAVGVGALVGLLLSPALCRFPRPGATNAVVAVLNGVAMVPLAFTTSVGVALACCFVIGVLWTPYSAVEATALQRLTPARHHGKVFGVQRALVITALPVGAAIGAFAQEHVGATTVLLGSAFACIVIALAALTVPALRARVT